MKREDIIFDKLVLHKDAKGNDCGELFYTTKIDGQSHRKYIYDFEIERCKELIAEDKRILPSQLESFGLLRRGTSVQDEKLLERSKNKVIPKNNNLQVLQYTMRQPTMSVKKLKVRDNKVTRVFKKGTSLLLVVGAIFIAYRHITKLPTSNVITYHNRIGVTNTARDIIAGYPKLESIMTKLMNSDYHDLNASDINYYKKCLELMAKVNNDADEDYFSIAMTSLVPDGTSQYSLEVLNKLTSLYRNIRVNSPGSERYHYDSNNADKYLVYALSLITGGEVTYTYEDVHKRESVAATSEAFEFNRMPEGEQLQILIQIREVLSKHYFDSRSLGYNVYSFDSVGFKQDEFIARLNERIDELTNKMSEKCSKRHL